MRNLLLAILVTLALAAPSEGASPLEYKIAREGKLYAVINSAENRILLKASGLELRTFQISANRLWGSPPGTKVMTLVAKKASSPPKRDVIVLTAEKKKEEPKDAKSYELKTLELKDMPSSFSMIMDDGTRISVIPPPADIRKRIATPLHLAWWYLSRPLISDWNYVRRRPYSEILLTLDENDARTLYWSLDEGSRCLFLAN